jgi:hypothetical protein
MKITEALMDAGAPSTKEGSKGGSRTLRHLQRRTSPSRLSDTLAVTYDGLVATRNPQPSVSRRRGATREALDASSMTNDGTLCGVIRLNRESERPHRRPTARPTARQS